MSIARKQMRRALAIRLAAAGLAASVTLLSGGCGGKGQLYRVSSHLGRASIVSFSAVHSAQQVVQHFRAVTGIRLTVSPDSVSWDIVSPADTDVQTYNHFGAFTIDVLHDPGELSSFTTDHGRPLNRDAQGVYWSPASGGGWSAVKVYGNVVLEWSSDAHSTNAQFRLLDAILSTLGRPASAVEAKLPPSEQSCEARGITVTSRREGTCSENGVGLTVVNSASVLHAADYDVQMMKLELGAYVPSKYTLGAPVYAKGAFLAVALHLSNTGSAPVDDLSETELKVGDRYYSQDSSAGSYLDQLSTFPVEPGEDGVTVLVYDIPRNLAATAVSQGELVFPEQPSYASVDDATQLGAIRLAGAPGNAQQRAAEVGTLPA